LAFVDCTRHPIRNRVIVLLSAKAGLRAGEIASLTWDMVLDAGGKVGYIIELRDHAAKEGQRPADSDSPRACRRPFRWRQTSTERLTKYLHSSGRCRIGRYGKKRPIPWRSCV
jgi:integrase